MPTRRTTDGASKGDEPPSRSPVSIDSLMLIEPSRCDRALRSSARWTHATAANWHLAMAMSTVILAPRQGAVAPVEECIRVEDTDDRPESQPAFDTRQSRRCRRDIARLRFSPRPLARAQSTLLRPLSGESEWVEFAGSSVVSPVWEGRACFEEWEGDAPDGHMSAVSLHLYDPRAKQWRLHWATQSRRPHWRADDRQLRARARRILRPGAIPMARRSFCVSCGSRAAHRRADSSRRSPTMAARRGRPTGSWTSRAPPRGASGIARTRRRRWHARLRLSARHVERAQSQAHGYSRGATYWYEYDGTSHEYPIWNGDGNLEEYNAVLPSGAMLRGVALRSIEPDKQRWTINWANGANGTLDTPMTDCFQERHRHVLQPGAAEWPADLRALSLDGQQAMALRAGSNPISADGGHTWEMNWIMDFSRTGS